MPRIKVQEVEDALMEKGGGAIGRYTVAPENGKEKERKGKERLLASSLVVSTK